MRLVGTAEDARPIRRQTHIDHTGQMRKWARSRIRALSRKHLCGFIFKSRSPSSGMTRVKVYSEDGVAGPVGSGIWAGAFMAAKELYAAYLPLLMETLKLQATVKEKVYVLTHLMGYFKRTLAPDEKQELLEVIEECHRGLTPLVVPVTLIRHYVRKYDEPYLSRQLYLNPHPAELMLRNHV
ncbi:MAG: DUF1722 domain-containing protein [Thermoleophilia bacterium]